MTTEWVINVYSTYEGLLHRPSRLQDHLQGLQRHQQGLQHLQQGGGINEILWGHFKSMLASMTISSTGNSTPYYPQANGQVEAINKVLKTMLRQMVGDHKSNWHHILFSSLWDYRTLVKTTTGFMPF